MHIPVPVAPDPGAAVTRDAGHEAPLFIAPFPSAGCDADAIPLPPVRRAAGAGQLGNLRGHASAADVIRQSLYYRSNDLRVPVRVAGPSPVDGDADLVPFGHDPERVDAPPVKLVGAILVEVEDSLLGQESPHQSVGDRHGAGDAGSSGYGLVTAYAALTKSLCILFAWQTVFLREKEDL